MRGLLKRLKVPGRQSRKGENGKVLVIAGSAKYHGAPAFCVLGARRFCDMLYFLPGDKSPGLLTTVRSIPEAIIVNEPIDADCVLYGPGLGHAKLLFSKLKHYKKKVIDGDGLHHLKKSDLKGTIITPHEGEFRRLFGAPSTPQLVQDLAMKYKCTILKKGPTDFISNGEIILRNTKGNPGMTKGGTGDVLSGLTAAFFSVNEPIVAASVAAYISGIAGDILYKKYKTAYCASDVAEILPEAYSKAMK